MGTLLDDIEASLGPSGAGAVEAEEARLVVPRRKRAPRRSEAKRRWDQENPKFSYRLDPLIPEKIREVQRYYRDEGYRVTLSQIAEDLLRFALERWEEEEVAIYVQEMEPDVRAVARNSQ